MSIWTNLKVTKSFCGTLGVKKIFLGSQQIWIANQQIAVPTVSGTYTYNGSEQTVQLIGYAPNTMTYTGDMSATNAGTYSLTFTPKQGYSWDAEGQDVSPRTITWSIDRATLTEFTLVTNHMTYDGSPKSVIVENCKSGSMNATYSTSGTWTATNEGAYTATVTGSGNFQGSLSVDWTIIRDYLCFKSTLGSNANVTLNSIGSPSWTGSYSTDGLNWSSYVLGTTITLPTVGDKVYFKGDITSNFSTSDYTQFVVKGSVNITGNCNSMYSSSNFENMTTLEYEYCYHKLFKDVGQTIDISLPATILSPYCYANMFDGGSGYAGPYVLPATSLATGCYQSMYGSHRGFSSVVPQLPAQVLAPSCYANMFFNCKNLRTPPELPATTLAVSCYTQMFRWCSSLRTAPALPATTLAINCYNSMFVDCTSLKTVPALPATTLVDRCYSHMFEFCTGLIVSDSPGDGYNNAWRIPTSGAFANTSAQSDTFFGCLGTRSSDDMPGVSGQSYTYYTQNTPV